MYPVSEEYLKSVEGDSRAFPTRCKFDWYPHYITQRNIRTGSYTDVIDGNSVLSMGNACANKIQMKIQDLQDELSWKGEKFIFEKGLVVNGQTEWVPWGTFWVVDASTSNNGRTVGIVAYDYMYKLSKMEYQTSLVAPFHYRDLLDEFLAKTGLTLSTSLELPERTDEAYTILSWPDEKFSYSAIAGHLAGMVAGNAHISVADPTVLEFKWFTPTGTLIKDTLYQDGFEKLADEPLRLDYVVTGTNKEIVIENEDDFTDGEMDFSDFEIPDIPIIPDYPIIDPTTVPEFVFVYNNDGTASVALSPEFLDDEIEINIPGGVTYNGTTYTVTSIADSGFENSCATRVVIPPTVKTIGERAFMASRNIESVLIPVGVEEVRKYAFFGCTALTAAVIPESITYLGMGAFTSCTNLSTVYWRPAELETVGENYGHYVFSQCPSLNNFVISDGVKILPEGMLRSCDGIKTIKIPSSVEIIGSGAFYSSGLVEITIPATVKTIKAEAFCVCQSLKKVTWNPVEMETSSSLFEGCIFSNCDALDEFIIADGVRIIPGFTLGYCDALKTINIPNSVETIGNYAFIDCDVLESVTIPSSVRVIGSNAFYLCNNLTSILIYRSEGSIAGSPWGAPNATVSWMGGS